MALPEPAREDLSSLRAWVDEFSGHVSRCEFDEAAKQYDAGILSFSSFKDVVEGIDQFVDEQWKQVWPTMTGFRLQTEHMRAVVSPDRCMAVVAVTWESTGYHEDGTPFDRPGRATIGLLRADVDDAWRGVHGHFSLKRGVPQRSFGPPTG